jgi:hypothetical protein
MTLMVRWRSSLLTCTDPVKRLCRDWPVGHMRVATLTVLTDPVAASLTAGVGSPHLPNGQEAPEHADKFLGERE